MITIVNFGLSNVKSVANMVKKVGYDCVISNDPDILAAADKLILPGVGSFDAVMNVIHSVPGLIKVMEHKALEEKIPVLGICLGMQILGRASEEGSMPGLGWIGGTCRKFPKNNTLKVPHMGWATATPKKESYLTKDTDSDARYYFVHSYHFELENENDCLMKSHYMFDFNSAISKENIIGLQFHPEKSSIFGMNLIKNFCIG